MPDRIQFTCKDCGKEVDREPHSMDIDGLTPVRCAECAMKQMARSVDRQHELREVEVDG
ncbi:MAG: hypothetical protein ABEI52_11910 [Halobacteriaceae archaeon]